MSALKFSPSGRHFAVAVGRRLQLWQTPSTPGTETNGEIEFAPFVLHRDLAGHFDDIQNIEWSSDSRFLLTASKDLTARVWSLDPEEGFEPTTLSGHRYGVVCAWFDANQELVSFSDELSIYLLREIKLPIRSTLSVRMVLFSAGSISQRRTLRRARTLHQHGGGLLRRTSSCKMTPKLTAPPSMRNPICWLSASPMAYSGSTICQNSTRSTCLGMRHVSTCTSVLSLT